MKNQLMVGVDLPSHSNAKNGYKPVRKHRRKPPQQLNQLHLSLSPEQTSNLLDCLFFTVSEVQPEPFRKKALDLIKQVQSTPGFQVMKFESERAEEGGPCECA